MGGGGGRNFLDSSPWVGRHGALARFGPGWPFPPETTAASQVQRGLSLKHVQGGGGWRVESRLQVVERRLCCDALAIKLGMQQRLPPKPRVLAPLATCTADVVHVCCT